MHIEKHLSVGEKKNLLMQFASEGQKSWRSFANKEDGMMISAFGGGHEKLCS